MRSEHKGLRGDGVAIVFVSYRQKCQEHWAIDAWQSFDSGCCPLSKSLTESSLFTITHPPKLQ